MCTASLTDDAALKTCLEGIGMCSSMVSDTNLLIVKKKMNYATMTADETKQWDDVTKACYASQFCDDYANLMFQGTEPDCKVEGTELDCNAKTGCVWLAAGTGANQQTMCMPLKKMRENFDAKALGDDSCWGAKVQKAKGKAGLTDAALKIKMQEERTKYLDCSAKTDMAQCTAPCSIEKQTTVSCDATGNIKGANMPDKCTYDSDDLTSAKQAEMWSAYFPTVSTQITDSLVAVDRACKAHTDRAACDAAVYTAAETAAAASAESTGVASGAIYNDPTRSVVMMVFGFFAASGFAM